MITVIIPCYNAEKYLKECIEDLLNKPNSMEIIIVNDASTDGTGKIASDLENSHGNIVKVITLNENRGQGHARNVGINNASGEWIIFLDVDDYLTKDIISEYEEVVDSNNKVDIVITNFAIEEKGANSIHINSTFCKDGYVSKMNLLAKYGNGYDWSYLSCIGNKLYSKKFINENNIRFKDEYSYNEDGGFICEALAETNNIYILNKLGYVYIQHENSSMHSYRKNAYKSVNRVDDLLKALFCDNNLWEAKKQYYYEKTISTIVASLDNALEYGKQEDYEEIFYELTHNKKYLELFEEVKNSDKVATSCREMACILLNDLKISFAEVSKKKYLNKILEQIYNKGVGNRDIYIPYEKVALYGAGVICKYLIKLLKDNNIAIEYVVDKNKFGEKIGDISIININKIQEQKNVDAIIVTTLYGYTEIEAELKKNSNIGIFENINSFLDSM